MRIYMILSIIFLTGCGYVNNSQSNTVISLSDLTANNWTVTQLSDKPVIDGSLLVLSVALDGKVTGNGGVNVYIGLWQLDEQQITASTMSATKMYRAEPKGIMEQESQFLTLLSEVTAWNIIDEQLQLFHNDKLILSLKKSGKTK